MIAQFPDGWLDGRTVVQRDAFILSEGVVVALLLDDGANLWAMVFRGERGGAHMMRSNAPGMGLLEQETVTVGKPDDRDRQAVEAAWQRILNTDLRSAVRADADERSQ